MSTNNKQQQSSYKYSIDSWKNLDYFKVLKLNQDPIFTHLMQSLYSIQQFNKDIIKGGGGFSNINNSSSSSSDDSIYYAKNSEELILNDKINNYIDESIKRLSNFKQALLNSNKPSIHPILDNNNNIEDEAYVNLVDPFKRNYLWINGSAPGNLIPTKENNNKSTKPTSTPQNNGSHTCNISISGNSNLLSNNDQQHQPTSKYILNQPSSSSSSSSPSPPSSTTTSVDTNPLAFYSLLSGNYSSKSIVIPYLNNSGNVPNKCSKPNIDQEIRNNENENVQFLLKWECSSVVREYSLMMISSTTSSYEVIYRGHNNFYTTPSLEIGNYSFKVKATNRFGVGETSEELLINNLNFKKPQPVVSSTQETTTTPTIPNTIPTATENMTPIIEDLNNNNKEINNSVNNSKSTNKINNIKSEPIPIVTKTPSTTTPSLSTATTTTNNSKFNSNKDKKRKKNQQVKFKNLLNDINVYLNQIGKLSTQLSLNQCEEIHSQLILYKEKYQTFTKEDDYSSSSSLYLESTSTLDNLETSIENANQLLESFKLTSEWREIIKNVFSDFTNSTSIDNNNSSNETLVEFVNSLSNDLPEQVKIMIFKTLIQVSKKKLTDNPSNTNTVKSKASYLLTLFSKKGLFNTNQSSELDSLSKQLLPIINDSKKLQTQTNNHNQQQQKSTSTKQNILHPPSSAKLQINTTPTVTAPIDIKQTTTTTVITTTTTTYQQQQPINVQHQHQQQQNHQLHHQHQPHPNFAPPNLQRQSYSSPSNHNNQHYNQPQYTFQSPPPKLQKTNQLPLQIQPQQNMFYNQPIPPTPPSPPQHQPIFHLPPPPLTTIFQDNQFQTQMKPYPVQFSPSNSCSSNSTSSSPSTSPSFMLNSLSDQIYTDLRSQNQIEANCFIVSPPQNNIINTNSGSNNNTPTKFNSENHDFYNKPTHNNSNNSSSNFSTPFQQFQWLTPVLSNLGQNISLNQESVSPRHYNNCVGDNNNHDSIDIKNSNNNNNIDFNSFFLPNFNNHFQNNNEIPGGKDYMIG